MVLCSPFEVILFLLTPTDRTKCWSIKRVRRESLQAVSSRQWQLWRGLVSSVSFICRYSLFHKRCECGPRDFEDRDFKYTHKHSYLYIIEPSNTDKYVRMSVVVSAMVALVELGCRLDGE